MNANNVEKHGIVMLNVKLQVKGRLKIINWLLELLFNAFALSATTKTVCFALNFCISWCAIYGAEQNF